MGPTAAPVPLQQLVEAEIPSCQIRVNQVLIPFYSMNEFHPLACELLWAKVESYLYIPMDYFSNLHIEYIQMFFVKGYLL